MTTYNAFVFHFNTHHCLYFLSFAPANFSLFITTNKKFININLNAIKFTSEGFVKLEAYLKEQKEQQAVIEFIVSDSGIGIEQNKLESIFNSFSQASEDTSRKYGRTGLGLPITKRLIELQGGEMTVASNFGKGSVFTFCITYDIAKNVDAPSVKPVYTSQHYRMTKISFWKRHIN